MNLALGKSLQEVERNFWVEAALNHFLIYAFRRFSKLRVWRTTVAPVLPRLKYTFPCISADEKSALAYSSLLSIVIISITPESSFENLGDFHQ